MVSFVQRAIVPAGVLVREVAGESVILNLNSETYFGLDGVGTRMWSVLTESESIQQAFEILVDEYNVDADTLRDDLVHLIETLVNHGLLELGQA